MQKTMSLVLVLLLLSCSDEMHMLFPEGPQGPQGLSAYEVWVKAVEDGEVGWPKDRTDINNFFIFLKGKDGANGLSAYEIWKEQVETGLDNPHNPGTEWPKDQITLQDFWYYLSGAPGQDGVTPHVGDNGNWWIGDTDTGVPARGKDGANGTNGKDGKDGKDAVAPTVEIGPNGNWYINGEDTGVPARGKDGQNGQDGANGQDGQDGRTPTITIGDNGNWFVDSEDSGVPATGPKGADGKDGANGSDGQDGKDGKDALWAIGDNGNWWYWDYPTEQWVDSDNPSTGPKGDPGQNGTNGSDGQNGTQFCIGENGNWWVYNYETGQWEDTGMPSQGGDGQDGTNGTNGSNGLSAYDLWVIAVSQGLADPHNPSQEWPKDKTSMSDFWEYLRGADGKDGKDGKDGVDASGVIQPQPSLGYYNVIADYSNSPHREYVLWTDGSVRYTVYNDQGQRVGAGVQISGMPKVGSDKVYVTDSQGRFAIPKEDLPTEANNGIDVYGQPKVTLTDNTTPQVASATYVPCRMKMRLEITNTNLGSTSSVGNAGTTNVKFQLYRKIDVTSEWEEVPTWIGESNGCYVIRRFDENLNQITTVPAVSDGAEYDLTKQDYGLDNILLASHQISIKRKVMSTDHFDFTKTSQCKNEASLRWYGKTDHRYFLQFQLTKRWNHEGICYGEAPVCEMYVEEVPLVPMPYFTELKCSYDIDNTNINLEATYCHDCLAHITHLYLPNYKEQTERINQTFDAYVPDTRAAYRDFAGLMLYAIKNTGTGEQVLRSNSYSINYLLTSPLSIDNVLNGSRLAAYMNSDASRTLYSFYVGTITETGTGSNASFMFDSSNELWIKHAVTISTK